MSALYLLLIPVVFLHTVKATIKVWVDTDIATDVDDTLAILELIAMESEFEIVGCTTVATYPLYAAMFLKKYLSLYDLEDIPIYPGPLHNETLTKNFTGVHYNYYYDTHLVKQSEFSHWQSLLETFPPPISLFNSADIVYTIGPLTTIAVLLTDYSGYKIKQMIQMGASILKTPLPEMSVSGGIIWDYNLRIDPDASWDVLTSPYVENVAFITGNITLKCWMTKSDLDSMEAVQDKYPAYPLTIDEIKRWHKIMADNPDFTKTLGINITSDLIEFMHDPLTVSYSNGVDTWLVMEEVDVVFWINDNQIFQTINGSGWTVRTGYDDEIYSRTANVSVGNDCSEFLKWYFHKVNNIDVDNDSQGNAYEINSGILVLFICYFVGLPSF